MTFYLVEFSIFASRHLQRLLSASQAPWSFRHCLLYTPSVIWAHLLESLKIWLWNLVKQAVFFFLTHKGKRTHFPLGHYLTSSSALTYARVSILTAEKMEKMCLWAMVKLDFSNAFSLIYTYLSLALFQIWFKGKEKLLCMAVGLKVYLKLYFVYFIS